MSKVVFRSYFSKIKTPIIDDKKELKGYAAANAPNSSDVNFMVSIKISLMGTNNMRYKILVNCTDAITNKNRRSFFMILIYDFSYNFNKYLF